MLVMITCCNNAATCSLFLSRFEDARKFAKNALILIDALYEKREKSKILELLYREGMEENKIFGVWKVKSLVLIARGLAESYESEDAISTLKKALGIVTTYKREGESTYQQFVSQEKQIRRLHKTCKQRIIAERKKEKQRAQAFFRSPGSKKPSKQENTSANTTQMLAETVQRKQVEETKEVPSSLSKARESSDRNSAEDLSVSQDSSKKRVTCEDRSKPGSNTNVEDDRELLQIYRVFNEMDTVLNENREGSEWVIRFELDKQKMMDNDKIPKGSFKCDTCQYLKKRWDVSNLNK